MRVLYDHQIFSLQDYGGVSRYFYELFTHFPRDSWDISVSLSNNYYLFLLSQEYKIKYLPFLNDWKSCRKPEIMLQMGKPYSLYKILRSKFDILHLTHYESFGCSFTRKPVVVTYHDKIYSSYCFDKRTISEQRKCLNRADAIITISQSTKKDLLHYFDIPESKVSVIYHGTPFLPRGNYVKPLCDYPYILFVGCRVSYKNFDTFLLAFGKLSKKYDDIHIVCCGSPLSDVEHELITRLKIKGKVKTMVASDQELQNLYENALFFIYPSKNEGFGLPLLEAMSNKCPVLCSQTSCFPEIAEDAALYFDPDSVDSIYSTMEHFVSHSEIAASLKIKGLERSKYFSWDKCAEEHYNVYKSLI